MSSTPSAISVKVEPKKEEIVDEEDEEDEDVQIVANKPSLERLRHLMLEGVSIPNNSRVEASMAQLQNLLTVAEQQEEQVGPVDVWSLSIFHLFSLLFSLDSYNLFGSPVPMVAVWVKVATLALVRLAERSDQRHSRIQILIMPERRPKLSQVNQSHSISDLTEILILIFYFRKRRGNRRGERCLLCPRLSPSNWQGNRLDFVRRPLRPLVSSELCGDIIRRSQPHRQVFLL